MKFCLTLLLYTQFERMRCVSLSFLFRRNRWSSLYVLIVVIISVVDCSSIVDDSSDTAKASMVDSNELDCGMRTLAWAFARDIVDEGAKNGGKNNKMNANILNAVNHALEIGRICKGETNLLNGMLREQKIVSFDREEDPNRLRRSSRSRTFPLGNIENDGDDNDDDILNDLCNSGTTCIFVSATDEKFQSADNEQNGSRNRPWTSVHQAVEHARSLRDRTS